MTLNSSDFYRMKNPVGEAEVEQQQPSELEQLRAQQQQLLKKLQEVEQREQSTSDKFRKYMEDSNAKQSILRQEIERRAATAPSREEPRQQTTTDAGDDAGKSWLELIGLAQAQSEDTTVADTQQPPKYLTEEEIDRRVEEKHRKLLQQQQEQYSAQQQRVADLANDLKENHKDISDNPQLQNFFAQTANEIQQINPNLSIDEVYKMALNKTKQTAQMFTGSEGRKPKQPQTPPPQNNPYTLPNQPTGFRQPQQQDPFGAYYDNASEADVKAHRQKEIDQIRKNHLSKFIR